MTENDRKTSSLRPYCVLTGCLLIPHPVRHLELSTNKGMKNVRETSDIGKGGEQQKTQKTQKNSAESK